MVYIIGVDHTVQYRGPIPEFLRTRFRDYLLVSVATYSIQIVAEEFNEELLKDVLSSDAGSVKEAAEIAGIQHRYCEPVSSERERLGIPWFSDIKERVLRESGISNIYALDSMERKHVFKRMQEIDRSYWRIREVYWFNAIRDVITLPMLFVCGHEHSERFQRLIVGYGHKAEVLQQFWESEAFMDYGTLFSMS